MTILLFMYSPKVWAFFPTLLPPACSRKMPPAVYTRGTQPLAPGPWSHAIQRSGLKIRWVGGASSDSDSHSLATKFLDLPGSPMAWAREHARLDPGTQASWRWHRGPYLGTRGPVWPTDQPCSIHPALSTKD